MLFCSRLSSTCEVTSSPARATAEEELEEDAAKVLDEDDDKACLVTPPVEPPIPLWLPVVCLDGLR